MDDDDNIIPGQAVRELFQSEAASVFRIHFVKPSIHLSSIWFTEATVARASITFVIPNRMNISLDESLSSWGDGR